MSGRVNKRLDSEEIFSKLWSAKWRILFTQAAIAALCLAVLLYWPRSYRSEARIFLQLGREEVSIDPTAAVGQTISVQQSDREDEIATAIDVIKGRGLIGKVVQDLSPEVVLGYVKYGEPGQKSEVTSKFKELLGSIVTYVRQIDPMSDSERAVMDIESNMKVQSERKSEVIAIEFESETPQLARLVVDRIVNKYKEEHTRLHRTEGSQSFFDDQQLLLETALSNATELLRLAKNRIGVASINGHRDTLEARIREVSQNASETERNFKEIEARIATIRTQLIQTPGRIASMMVDKANYAADLQSQQLYTLQLTELEYKIKYAPNHPKLVALREQLAQAEAKLDSQDTRRPEKTDDINPIHRELSMDLAKADAVRSGYKEKLITLKTQQENLVKEIQALNGHEVEIEDLEREVKLIEKKYLTYSESVEQTRISKALESNKISSVSIAQEATLQERPVSPSKLMIIAFGALAAVGCSVLVGFISVQLDSRLLTPNSVSNKLGIPLLATLPNFRSLAKLKL